ncbi:ABC transporter permease [Kribbella solani]|uniref:Peptide/nickel transport system permease protein n=1 Tax=Kribbella solani TaxID=236067 RepID=A0A841DLH1_9ACTN|nr:ABC transporter permease [Kribbella solani]MBB5977277.1 peptide/nickel transport system permease protein [Kribbella solani]
MATIQTRRPVARTWSLRAHPWLYFVSRRTGRLLASLAVLVTAAFLMIHLIPGDPVRSSLGLDAPASLVESRRHELGLDDPLWRQYLDYLGRLVHGDLGRSLLTGNPVSSTVRDRLPATVQIAAISFVLVIAIAIPLGLVAAVRTRGGRRRGLDLGFASVTSLAAAVPEFLLAVGLVYVFAVRLGWAPVAGHAGLSSYVLPVVALSLGPAGALARIVRVEVNAVLDQDYIRTARAKRLPDRLIYLRHALPNALTATLTLGGLLLMGLIAGSVLVENVFAWPGLGSTIVQSILNKDYPVVQAVVLVYGVGVLLANLVVDVLLAVLDPRSTIRTA